MDRPRVFPGAVLCAVDVTGRKAMKKDPYVKMSKRYDRQIEPAAQRLRKLGHILFPPRENLKILDVACGTGNQLMSYDREGCQLFGIDSSPSMLEIARQKLGQGADLRLEDASHMSFPSGNFDLVTIVLALHEMPAVMRFAVLQECRRVAKPDGRILVIDFHFGPYSFPKGWAQKLFIIMMEMGAGREHFRNYRDFLRRRGLPGLVSELNARTTRHSVASTGTAAVYLITP
jgi:ubiquinone/menaquinone biosynthesis C-methylase UbiE